MNIMDEFKDELTPIIDWLNYISYESNRIRNPHIDPIRWRTLYKQAEEYEEIFNNTLKQVYSSK